MSQPAVSESVNTPFVDVVLRFTRQIYYDNEDAFQLEVRKSPGPLPGGAFRANIRIQMGQLQKIFSDNVAVNQFFYRYEVSPDQSQQKKELETLGNHLYELLPDTFRGAFTHLVQDIFEKGQGIRLILEARAGDRADRLLSLPWEILFFKETSVYFARSPRVLIMRRLLDAARRSPVQMEAPFSVCHVIAHTSASPQKYWIGETLQQVEREAIQQVVGSGYYRLVEKPGSVEKMQAALREKHYHIVHFLGHGELQQFAETDAPEESGERGYLRFVDANGESEWIAGEQLQHLLGFTPTVQLVVLNACHGGTGAAGNIALELIYNGLPYVVAMQSDILQDAAGYFIRAFYAELQRGQSVEYAVAVGRSAIAINMPQTNDWCLPVLYTNTGLPKQAPLPRAGDYLWQWAGRPEALKWIGTGSIILGILHTIVGFLLLLSKAMLPTPAVSNIDWITGGLAMMPFIITAGAYLTGILSIPRGWSFSTRVALVLRSLSGASIGLGIPILYAWYLLLLLAALGFWNLLSLPVRLVLLGLVFTPCLLNSYAQLIGQGRAFIVNAQIELPPFQWSELLIIITGYGMLFLPWMLLKFAPGFLALPRANLVLGVILIAFGYFLNKTKLN